MTITNNTASLHHNWRASAAPQWEKKDSHIHCAILRATSTNIFGEKITQWVAFRLDKRSGAYRVDIKTYPYASPWEAVDGGQPVRTLREAKRLVRQSLLGR